MKKFDRIVLFVVFALLIGIIMLLILMYSQKGYIRIGRVIVKENVIEEKKVMSENIVFLGDSITQGYDLDKYIDDHYRVQSGKDGNLTDDILKDLDKRVYQYNPSKVFVLIGINNFIWKKDSADKVTNDIEEICDKIHERLPYTEIYIESIYPYSNKWHDNHDNADSEKPVKEKILSTNKAIKKYAIENDFTYIDIYSSLANEDGYFDSEYTDDGLHPNEEAYKVITEKLSKYLK